MLFRAAAVALTLHGSFACAAHVNSDVREYIQQQDETGGGWVGFALVDPGKHTPFYNRAYFDGSEQVARLEKALAKFVDPGDNTAGEYPVSKLQLYPKGGYGYALVNSRGLELLEAQGVIEYISLLPKYEFSTAEGFQVTQGAQLATQGLVGTGVQVAVLDGNFHATHPSLVGAIHEEVCFTNLKLGCNGQNGSYPTPAIGAGVASGPSASNWAHGTGVAGIIVSRGIANPPHPTPPAAPTQGVQLTAIRIADSQAPDPILIHQALRWIEDQLDNPLSTRRWKVINLSIASNLEDAQHNFDYHGCEHYLTNNGLIASYEDIEGTISRLFDKGVIVVAASGNRYGRIPGKGIAHPACLSTVVSASSVWDSNSGSYSDVTALPSHVCDATSGKNACYSNRNWMTKVAAPGSTITSPWVNFSSNPPYTPQAFTVSDANSVTAQHGTSFAAPAVASCIAQIYQQIPSLDPRRLFSAISQETSRSTVDATSDVYTLPLLKCANTLARMQESVHGLTLGRVGLSGAWFNPAEDGQGFVFEINLHDPSNRYIFGGWYTFRQTGSAQLGGLADNRWLVLQNSGALSPATRVANLVIYQTRGGTFNTANPIPNPLQLGESIPIGSATLRFHNCRQATLQYSITSPDSIVGQHSNGVVNLSRVIPSTVRCTENDYSQAQLDLLPEQESRAEHFWWSGGWFNPSSSGQGLVIEVNAAEEFPFLSWYTTSPGTPAIGENLFLRGRWFTLQPQAGASGPTIFRNSCNEIADLAIFRTTDGRFRVPIATDPVATASIGTAKIKFHSCTTATLKYEFGTSPAAESFGGLSGSIPLQRLGSTALGPCNFSPDIGSCPF